MSLPVWLSVIAALDDDALAALGNRGLVRRAVRLVSENAVTLVSVTDAEVGLTCDGAAVKVLPGGPSAVRCSCPVAGVCVHVVAVCVWAREEVGASGDPATSDSGVAPDAPDALSDLLSWDPAAVNRAAGVAAVRAVAAEPLDAAAIETRPGQVIITWPGSPTVIALAGVGFAGMLVEGTHSEVAERTWKLSAVVRAFAAHQRPWPWPDGVGDDRHLQAAQREAAADLAAIIENLVTDGMSQAGRDACDRLTRASQRARLDDLPLLARLATLAAGHLTALAQRSDDTTETQVLSALAQPWTLARTLATGPADPPPALIGRAARASAEATVGTLTPLAGRWWLAPSGAHGFTLHAWDAAAGRLEVATTGRAAGADPSFSRSWDAPILWGASASALCSGRLELSGAERRDDGTLSPTTRTRVLLGSWDGLDLDELAESVNSAESGLARTAFGSGDERLRIIRPRRTFGLGTIELDEVAQLLIWPVTDVAGRTHRLAMDADEANVRLLTWFVERSSVLAIVAVGDRPEAAFLPEKTGPRLVSLTLTPLPIRDIGPSWRRRILKLDQHRRAVQPIRELDDLQRLCASVGEVVESLAARGSVSLSPRQRETLGRRRREASDLGLSTLAAAIAPLLSDAVTAEALLRVRFVLDRMEALLAD